MSLKLCPGHFLLVASPVLVNDWQEKTRKLFFFFPRLHQEFFFFYCFGAELERNVRHLLQCLVSRLDFDIFKLRLRRCDWSDCFSAACVRRIRATQTGKAGFPNNAERKNTKPGVPFCPVRTENTRLTRSYIRDTAHASSQLPEPLTHTVWF